MYVRKLAVGLTSVSIVYCQYGGNYSNSFRPYGEFKKKNVSGLVSEIWSTLNCF